MLEEEVQGPRGWPGCAEADVSSWQSLDHLLGESSSLGSHCSQENVDCVCLRERHLCLCSSHGGQRSGTALEPHDLPLNPGM